MKIKPERDSQANEPAKDSAQDVGPGSGGILKGQRSQLVNQRGGGTGGGDGGGSNELDQEICLQLCLEVWAECVGECVASYVH